MARPRGVAPKASEKTDGARTLPRKSVPSARTLPGVASVTLRVEQLGADSPERVFRTSDLGESIDCTNPLCDGGGFRIRGLLEEMARKRERSREEMATCVGNERVPGRGKRRGRVRGHCARIYRVRIDVRYRKDS